MKAFLILFLIIIFLAIIIPQYKAEQYLKFVKQDGVFKDRERLSYIPFTVFYIKHKYIDEDYYKLSQYARVPYEIKNIRDSYFFGFMYGTYYAHSYYDLDTLKKYYLINSSIKRFAYNFDSSEIVGDTLKLVSHNQYFYRCFGKFSNPEELTNHFKKNFEVKKETGDDILYRVKRENSFIKYFFNEDDKIMDLVSGEIKSSEFVMTNGLRVGLNKSEVENILFPIKKTSIDNVNTVQLITALMGVWIDLKFDGNKLTKIKIDTDYQVNKK